MLREKNLHFITADTEEAQIAGNRLAEIYGQVPLSEAEVIVVLGGDGTMLQTMRDNMHKQLPIFGMNRGSIGFLMNAYSEKNLQGRIAKANREDIHPLRMVACSESDGQTEALAINEVSLFRQSYQAAKIRVSVDDKVRMDELICDGIMVATPTGSTAYNLSSQGPILPLIAPLMALTPVSPFRPRRWHGALLPDTATVRFEMLEAHKRPVNSAADNVEVKSVQSVTIRSAKEVTATILFDANHSWDERILSEQFRY